MALLAWQKALRHSEELVNLEALRQQLTRRVALFICLASLVAAWATLPFEPFPLAVFGLVLAGGGLGMAVQRLAERRPQIARFALVWGLLFLQLLSLALLPVSWLPFLGVLLTFMAALLIPGHEFLAALAVGLATVWLVHSGGRAYPLPGVLISLVLGAGCSSLVALTLYTALEWTWNTQQEANRLLEQARSDRGELRRTLKSLDLAYSLLERTQDELVFARRQAEEARQMKERFAANISHELRTPLNLVLGFSEIMYLSPEVYGPMTWPPALRRDVYQIYRGTRHLTGMIDDVLDLSRFEMASFTLSKELTPLTPFLRATAELARDLFPQNAKHSSDAVRFEVDIAADLPALEIDRTRIRQVLLNLLNNARSFTERGSVRLTAQLRPTDVLINVSDSGPGIPPDKLENVFQEFYQVDTSLRRKHQGVGLGLAISKRFVEAHEGHIWAENTPSESDAAISGATLCFTLPLGVVSLPNEGTPRVSGARSIRPRSRPALLVVNTNLPLASWLSRHLPEFDVIPAEGPLDDAIRLYHPRAVLCNMPPATVSAGFPAFTTTLPVPLIECSLPSEVWLAGEMAVAGCLTKPIASGQLLTALQAIVPSVSAGARPHVLIIDDDRGFVQLIERMLQTVSNPYRTSHAYGGAEGLAAMKDEPPDIVLLDLMMPEVDGFAVLAEMRGRPALAQMPVLILTATSFAEDALQQRGSQIVVRRGDGLRALEVLSCVRAAATALEPRYDEKSAPGLIVPASPSTPAAAPPG